MPPSRLILGLLLIVVTALVGTYIDDPSDTEQPDVEWDAETDEGEIQFIHRGGEDVSRDALVVVIRDNDSVDERITNLASADHPRVIHPFSDETVSRGDSLHVAAPANQNTIVVLQWDGPTIDSTLVSYEFAAAEV